MNTNTKQAEILKFLCLGLSYVLSVAYVNMFMVNFGPVQTTIYITVLSIAAVIWLEMTMAQQRLLGHFTPSKVQSFEVRFWEVILVLLCINTYFGQIQGLTLFFIHMVVIYMVLCGTGHFLSDRSSPWTARVTVKRGDSRDRLARDNRTTSAALDRLNPKTNWARIKPGDVVRVLQYPKAVLVIHKGLRFADLSLKGTFFHRYAFTGQVRVPAGVYPVTREPGKTAHAYLRDIGVVFSPADRADLEMFLAPESSINVSDQ